MKTAFPMSVSNFIESKLNIMKTASLVIQCTSLYRQIHSDFYMYKDTVFWAYANDKYHTVLNYWDH